ncbi:tubby family protein [Skeletonema marinoi]|uniref:Tubby family protein n=1 Tax=Skeletonema marinoi TaxID=267567 RepID=A0AAD8YLS3_9STRA|nr:tubby family protein [Skeletonema marinoi]
MEPVRIGHPRSPKQSNDSASSNNDAAVVTAPNIFALPTEVNYQAIGFVQTVVTRFGSNRYELAFQVGGVETVALIAQKVTKSMTSNYHLFDALRGGENTKMTKKAGHYIGKLRRDKDQPQGCYTLYDSSREKQQLAAFVYDIPNLVSQVKEGQPPRKMQAVIPKYSEGNALLEEETLNIKHHNNRLMEHLHNGTWQHHDLVAVQTRPPSFHEGQYRLNFQGRVLTPSVKNMQLEDQVGQTFLQFGKVDDARFHLDFKAPFTAVSAFAAALAQFDL